MGSREQFEAWFKRDFHPDITGPYVKNQLLFAWQAATASTQGQMAALAAENAALKSAAKKVIKMNQQHAKDQHGDPMIAESWACVKVLRKANSENPATDAFIADQQAMGVEKFADVKNNEMFSLHPDTHAVGAIAATMSAQVKELKSFAQQLRDEVKP